MEDIVILEWRFTPKDYFEDEIRIECSDYEMIIKNGIVEARINPEVYGDKHKMRAPLHKNLNDRFLGVQLLMHKPYELSKASMHRLHPDGSKDVTVFAESAIIALTSDNVDLIVKDKDGNVVSDPRRDRIKKKKKLAELAEAYSSDAVAAFLLERYKAAVDDSDNELIHLFDILEALKKLFIDKKQAQNELDLNDSDWSRLGQLANDEPLNQGRHRGLRVEKLRDATKDELNEARTIARKFVEAYLVYLDERSKKQKANKALN